MDYSKWKKLFIILTIINIIWIFYNRVFASSAITIENPEQYTFTLANKFDSYSYYYVFYNPQFVYSNSTAMSFYFVASKSPITFRQAMASYGGVQYLTTYIKTQDSSQFYMYSQNLPSSNTFLQNITSFNSNVNSSASLKNSNSAGFTFEDAGVSTNTQFNNIVGLYISSTIEFDNGDVAIPDTIYRAPYFENLTEIENGYPDGVFISRGEYSENDALYFHLLKITNTVPDGNQSTYYYDSKVYKLTKDSKYYNTFPEDTENKFSYYYIKRSALTLDTNSSYLYVLSNSGDSISNSYGILQPDIPGGVYDVVESDTAGVITEQQALNDKIANINNNQQEVANNSNNINNFLNENTVSTDTENNVDTNLSFNNSSPQFSALQTNFISRLTSIVADFGNYSLDTVDTISIPVPHSNNTIDLRSDLMTGHIPNDIKTIIYAFWCFIFGKYFLNYLLLIYKLITTGQLIDYYSSNDEIIVTEVL